MTQKNQPTHQIRVGRVIASVWERSGDTGPRFNATFQRFYRKDEKWSYSDNFSGDDLLCLAKAADLAHTWISEQSSDADSNE